NGGIINGGSGNTYIRFRTPNDQQLIVNGSITNIGWLDFTNSGSTVSINGSGNISTRYDIRLDDNNNITVVNNLTGIISVGRDFIFEQLNCEFINNGKLNITNRITVSVNDNKLTNNAQGNISVGSDINPNFS